MCWICYANNLKAHIAEKDTNVYKMVEEANKKTCVSMFEKFCYYTDIEPDKVDLVLYSNIYGDYLRAGEGYHSYKSVSIPFNSTTNSYHLEREIKAIVLGKKWDLLRTDNKFYLATFIIPKGALYFTNEYDIIVSSRIKYTGKFVKL